MTVLIVGAGQIAREYVDICLDLGETPLVVTRGEAKAVELRDEYPFIEVVTGGLESYLQHHDVPSEVILATPITTLAPLCEAVTEAGASSVLAEKPLVLSSEVAADLRSTVEQHGTDVFVGFNRRHYESTELARTAIAEDGGVSSCWLDFTEATFRIDPAQYDDSVLRRWGIANSSHVIDMAFSLCGQAERLDPVQRGDDVPWHPTGSVFYGSGQTSADVPFSYHADWGAPGRWRIEINTPERKLLFSPLERLQVQESGTFEIVEYGDDYTIDTDYKPGFYRQTKRFLSSEFDRFSTLSDFEAELRTLEQIFGYS